MNTAISKICVICGQNVAGKPRTKDAEGHYYCQHCYYDSLAARLAKQPSMAVATSHMICPYCSGDAQTSADGRRGKCGSCGHVFSLSDAVPSIHYQTDNEAAQPQNGLHDVIDADGDDEMLTQLAQAVPQAKSPSSQVRSVRKGPGRKNNQTAVSWKLWLYLGVVSAFSVTAIVFFVDDSPSPSDSPSHASETSPAPTVAAPVSTDDSAKEQSTPAQPSLLTPPTANAHLSLLLDHTEENLTYYPSPDLSTIAFERDGSLYWHGKPGPKVDGSISSVDCAFSADGEDLSYAVTADKNGSTEISIMVDQTERWHGDVLGFVSPVFSADAKHFALPYDSTDVAGSIRYAVIDGVQNRPLPDVAVPQIDYFTFSRSGGHVAYYATDDKSQVTLIVDSKKTTLPNSLSTSAWGDLNFSPSGAPMLSADGQHVAVDMENIIAGDLVVIDGSVQAPPGSAVSGGYNDQVAIAEPSWSADGTRFAYVSGQFEEDNADLSVVVNGQTIFKTREVHRLKFLGSTNQLAWLQGLDGSVNIYVNGKSFGPFSTGAAIASSSDGAQWACHVTDEGKRTNCYVVDGNLEPSFNSFSPITFSQDSAHHAYVGYTAGMVQEIVPPTDSPVSGQVVRDGTPGATYDSALTPEFSPSGEHLAWWVLKDGRWYVAVDDNVQTQWGGYLAVLLPRIRGGGDSVACGACEATKDSLPSLSIKPRSGLRWDGDGTLHALVRDERGIESATFDIK